MNKGVKLKGFKKKEIFPNLSTRAFLAFYASKKEDQGRKKADNKSRPTKHCSLEKQGGQSSKKTLMSNDYQLWVVDASF